MLRAVIWDMDGVMADTEILWAEMEQEFFKRHKMEYRAGSEAAVMGRTQSEVIEWYKQKYGLRQTTHELLTERIALLEDIFRKKLKPNPGLYEALAYCKDTRLMLAVASASPRKVVEFILTHIRVREYFSVMITGDEVTRGKPDPQSFLLALEQMKIAVWECAVIEDSPRGLAAARAAGIRCIAMPDQHYSQPEQFVGADVIIRSLHEVPHALQQLA